MFIKHINLLSTRVIKEEWGKLMISRVSKHDFWQRNAAKSRPSETEIKKPCSKGTFKSEILKRRDVVNARLRHFHSSLAAIGSIFNGFSNFFS